jgi:hypothetical protein
MPNNTIRRCISLAPVTFATIYDDAGIDTSLWNTAWGVLSRTPAGGAGIAALTATYSTVVTAPSVALQSGRRYAVSFSARAMDASVATSIILNLLNNGASVGNWDKYISVGVAGAGYSGGSLFRWVIDGDGAAHVFALQAKTFTAASTGNIHAQDSASTGLVIEDIGPTTRGSTGAAPPDWTAADTRYSPLRQTITTIAATAYTLALADEFDLLVFNAATAIALTVPTNVNAAFPVGARVDMVQTGAGKVTVSGAGVTVHATPSAVLRAAGSAASLVKLSTDTWLLAGDLT